MIPGIGGNNLFIRKDFKAWTYMQVEALLSVRSGSSILSWFSYRQDFIDNAGAES